MDVQKNGFLSIEQVKDTYLAGKVSGKAKAQEISFNDILKQKSQIMIPRQDLRFSKHAAGRLEERNIALSDEQMIRLNDAARKASEKGIKESLVIVDSLAFIVNVPNNTVVTALDRTDSEDNVFTNIDGAVIV
ncbi:MAG: flagellar protein [Lachnospiraceae bacterium]|nr:flagellar protein [Lachnospiraceae bacterium]